VKRKKDFLKKICAMIIFFISLMIGIWLSLQKPLWNDEIYTQERAIDNLSYLEILKVRFVEGNNSPLFYLIQKGICDVASFKLPMKWEGEWYLSDPKSQVIMRIAPNFFISLSIACIFYFFARYYSYPAGAYALLVALSSHVIWIYWAEARPYALWIFLTTVQSLVFIRLMNEDSHSSRRWHWLYFIHILLALSVVLSLGQIFIISVLLFWIKDRRALSLKALFKKYFLLMVLPIGICLFYYFYMPASIFRYYLVDPLELIYANIPKDRILIVMVYACFLIFCFSQKKAEYKILFNKSLHPHKSRNLRFSGATYLLFLILMILFAGVILIYCKMREIPDQRDITLSDRYFMYLVPIEIIATSLFSISLVAVLKKNKFMLVNLLIGLFGLLIIRYLNTAISVFEFYN